MTNTEEPEASSGGTDEPKDKPGRSVTIKLPSSKVMWRILIPIAAAGLGAVITFLIMKPTDEVEYGGAVRIGAGRLLIDYNRQTVRYEPASGLTEIVRSSMSKATQDCLYREAFLFTRSPLFQEDSVFVTRQEFEACGGSWIIR